MPDLLTSPDAALIVAAGALVAGFTTGFSGFGTALVAAAFWYHALPAPAVPPLAAMASVMAQVVGLTTSRREVALWRAAPFVMGGLLGVPLGVALLTSASPEGIRTTTGAFLLAYAMAQLTGLVRFRIGSAGGRPADAAIGLGGGILGGFAGLSGPLPLVWLQLRGGPAGEQRATFIPYNLAVLAVAALMMALAGILDLQVLGVALFCLPITLLGAFLGSRAYARVSEATFRRVILSLLLASGLTLVGQGLV